MKIVYRIVKNEWFEYTSDLNNGVIDYDTPEEAIAEASRLNALVPEQDNVQYHVRVLDYWKK